MNLYRIKFSRGIHWLSMVVADVDQTSAMLAAKAAIEAFYGITGVTQAEMTGKLIMTDLTIAQVYLANEGIN